MNNILLRAITGSIFVALIVGALWLGIYTTLVVMSLFLILGLVEFFKLFKNNKIIQISVYTASIISFLIFVLLICTSFQIIPEKFSSLIFPLLFIAFLTELWRKKENPLMNIGIIAFSIFYLVVPFFLIISLNIMSDKSNPLAIGMFLLIWTNDTFAYLSGRFFGKTKLFERISPKKTWEGTIGGIIFTIGVGSLIGFYNEDSSILFWVVSAIIIAPCAIFGDLLESIFKRSLDIKDSGNILPGHGGILDRFDATLFTVPFFYCWVSFYSYF